MCGYANMQICKCADVQVNESEDIYLHILYIILAN